MITFNLPQTEMTTLVRVLYTISIFCTIPLFAMNAFEIFQKSKFYQNLPFSGIPKLKQVVSRGIIMMIVAFVASLVPKFGSFLNLNGAFASTISLFILPVSSLNISHIIGDNHCYFFPCSLT